MNLKSMLSKMGKTLITLFGSQLEQKAIESLDAAANKGKTLIDMGEAKAVKAIKKKLTKVQ